MKVGAESEGLVDAKEELMASVTPAVEKGSNRSSPVVHLGAKYVHTASGGKTSMQPPWFLFGDTSRPVIVMASSYYFCPRDYDRKRIYSFDR